MMIMMRRKETGMRQMIMNVTDSDARTRGSNLSLS